MRVEDELPECLTEEMLEPLPSHAEGLLPKAKTDLAKTKLLLVKCLRF